jgi:copper chaperone CopZ
MMHCAGCERTVKFALFHLPGVREVKTDRMAQTIEVDLVSDDTDLEKVKAQLDCIGYQVEAA